MTRRRYTTWISSVFGGDGVSRKILPYLLFVDSFYGRHSLPLFVISFYISFPTPPTSKFIDNTLLEFSFTVNSFWTYTIPLFIMFIDHFLTSSVSFIVHVFRTPSCRVSHHTGLVSFTPCFIIYSTLYCEDHPLPPCITLETESKVYSGLLRYPSKTWLFNILEWM